jgi:hypothetical protein
MMKKLVLVAMVLSLLFSGCQKQDDLYSLLLGTWVNTQVDNQAVLTDESFIMELRSDKVQMYATGYTLDMNNKTWIENDKYTYRVDGNILTIDGVGALGSKYHLELIILSVDKYTLSYSVRKLMIENVDYPDKKIYTFRKAIVDFSDRFVGTWYGRSTTPGSNDESYHCWEYFADGQFNYYYQDSRGLWIRKADNEGHYFLYGDLMASNYSNDLLSGAIGKAFECWNFSITGNTMVWKGLRENGQVTSYRMEKVKGPPTIP